MKNYELYHHGILGMKWGIRRYQNKDGTLTNAGKKRYSESVDNAKQTLADAKEEYKQAKRTRNNSRIAEANAKVTWAENNLANAKAKDEVSNLSGEKSKHRLKLEAEYQKKGLTTEEAEIAAQKRIKVEKAVAIAGAVTVTAALTAVGVHKFNESVDKVIKSDSVMKRLATDPSVNLHDSFYVARSQKDANRYVAEFGDSLRKGGRNVYQKNIKAVKDLKVASQKNALKTLQNLAKKDPNFVNAIKDQIGTDIFGYGNEKQKKTVTKALQNLQNGKIDKTVYEAFNLGLAGADGATKTGATQFYNALRRAGYDAIEDINDKKLSGYNTKSATIIFNKAKVAVESVRNVSASEIEEEGYTQLGYATMKTMGKLLLQSSVTIGSAMLAVKTMHRDAGTASNNEVIKKYKHDHPNSKLSDTEILNNYYA